MEGSAAPPTAAPAEQPDVIKTGEAIAKIVLIAAGQPELTPLVPLIGGFARTLDERLRARGIDTGPLAPILKDLDHLAIGGIEEIDDFRRRHGLT